MYRSSILSNLNIDLYVYRGSINYTQGLNIATISHEENIVV